MITTKMKKKNILRVFSTDIVKYLAALINFSLDFYTDNKLNLSSMLLCEHRRLFLPSDLSRISNTDIVIYLAAMYTFHFKQ